MKYVIFAIFVVLASVAYEHANATPTIKSKFSGTKHKLVGIVETKNNKDGTLTVTIDACGTLLEVTAANKEFQELNEVFVTAVDTAIYHACN